MQPKLPLMLVLLRKSRVPRVSKDNNLLLNLKQQQRWMVGRANNRSGVHGTHLPATQALDNAEVEKVINKGKEEKESKRKQIEEAVDSQLKKSGLETIDPKSSSD